MKVVLAIEEDGCMNTWSVGEVKLKYIGASTGGGVQGVRVYVRSVLVYTEKGRPGDRDKSACRERCRAALERVWG